jgi:hypothetical protein
MTTVQCATLFSALLGVFGTLFLFFGTYGLQSFEGGIFNSPAIQTLNEGIRAKNEARKVRQKIGLGLVCASFVVQAVTVFLPG